MKFNPNCYSDNTVMHCTTEEEAKNFCEYLHNLDYKWSSGINYNEITYWESYKEETCYNFKKGAYDSINYYKAKNFQILEWSDFMEKVKGKFTKSDLKTGDVILRRNGLVEIVCLETDSLINKGGFNLLSKIEEDLTAEKDLCSTNWDIMAVRRPQGPGDGVFYAFDHEFGELVYDREEEMNEEKIKKEDAEMAIKEISEKLELLKKFIKA